MQSIFNHLRACHDRSLAELKAYLAIPSISSDPTRASDVEQCARHTAQLLNAAGIVDAEVRKTAGHPVVTGSWLQAPGKPTLLIYGHYDVQPVDPLELWEHNPFEAHIQDDTIIARGSADDKGQLFMHLKVVEAFLKVRGRLPVNVKFIIEGEEEISSPSLPQFLRDHKEWLKSDVVVISDTSMWAPGVPAITVGLRGLSFLEIEVTGPARDLHSGEFGGAVANPAEILARLLAQVKDDQGRIQIPGFYDKVRDLSPVERAEIARVPFNEKAYRDELGVQALWGEAGYSPLERAWIRPTFEINGMWSGFTGVGAKTVLPAKAYAKVSTRLVPNQNPNEIAGLVEEFFNQRAPRTVLVKVKCHAGGLPFEAPLNSPYMTAAREALREAFNYEPLLIRAGGSIPIVAEFKNILGIDTLLLGFCLQNCRAHAPNENMYLPSFFTGMESLALMLEKLGS